MNNNIAKEILREVMEILPECWLFGGTLLGAVRDKSFISWDGDIDVGHSSIGITNTIVEEFKKRGYNITTYKFSHPKMEEFLPNTMGQYGKIIATKRGVKVEVCCFSEGKEHPIFGDVMYYASGTPRFFILPKSHIYPTTQINFYDFRVNIATNYEEQLNFVYGKDWNTPKKNWYNSADHYLCRERTIIELGGDDNTSWSKWTGRRVILKTYPNLKLPSDINTPIQPYP
jgi:hypothetical protein